MPASTHFIVALKCKSGNHTHHYKVSNKLKKLWKIYNETTSNPEMETFVEVVMAYIYDRSRKFLPVGDLVDEYLVTNEWGWKLPYFPLYNSNN